MNAGASAQGFSTTTVQGTVYLANGQPGTGVLQLSWPAFTTAGNQAVAAGRTNVQIGADGYVSVNLAPNLGATPAGLYYTAVYHLSDGTTSTEYWVVPAAAQASLSQVRAQVMPAAQAVQAVSKGYVDQSIAELTQSLLTASGGSLSGPLFLNGDPTQPTQAATKRYVDNEFAMALPLSGGAATGPLTGVRLGAAYQADQFPGADFGAKLQACVNTLDPVYGGTCDARNFTGTQAAGSAIVISTANATVQLPCATIATASQIRITPGTRNVTLRGCALRGASDSSGSQGGTVFLYSGTAPMIQAGDPGYAINTVGFHIDNVVINTTASSNSAAQAIAAYRTQEMDLHGLYLLGNSNQTGITLDGTGNYTGGTFQDIEFGGFGTALNAIGHQVANAATTDWVNASTFLRLHIDCPTNGGSPIAGTYGINLVQGDGNTFTGGDVEGCATALHLGPNAQNNTIVGLRNENSINQVVADAGSSYNNWITGGTMFTGQLTDNGTRNSFLDTFHRSFNGLNGDWYGSQTDTTITNHYRLGTGTGNERGLLNRYQTDYGYRWTMGLSDASSGAQFYQLLDELNNVYRLSIGQYNHGQAGTNNQTVLNAAGTGAVVLNGSSNAGTGGVIFGSGGPASSTVATINNTGSAQFNGTLQVAGASTFSGSTTVKNQADAEIDTILWAGATANQKESLIYKDYSGASQWYMVKDTNNNWALNSAIGGLDSFKAYQSNNSGDTYINAGNGSGHIRLNYEPGAGSETDIYSGPTSTLVAAFLGNTAIKFPGLAAASGHNCLQIDNSGYISNTGSGCATSGMNGTVNVGNAGQVAYYAGNGTVIAGTNSVAVSAGGTGATTAAQALQNLGAQPALFGVTSDGSSGLKVAGTVAAGTQVSAPVIGGVNYASQYPSQNNNGIASTFADSSRCGANGCTVTADPGYSTTEQPYAFNIDGAMTFPSTSSSHFVDQRKGYQLDLYHDAPLNSFTGANDYHVEACVNTTYQGATTGQAAWTGSKANCHPLYYQFAAPGIDLGTTSGSSGQHGPGGWSVNVGLPINGIVNTPGISEMIAGTHIKASIGDTTGYYLYSWSYGGAVAGSDEGHHLGALGGGEASTTYAGTITSGGAKATTVTVNCTIDCDTPGDGRYFIDLSAGISDQATAYTAPSGSTPGTFTTLATYTPSTFWGTLAADVKTPTGSPFGKGTTAMTFTVNSGSGNIGSPQVGDLVCFSGSFHEQANISSVSGTGPWTVTVPLRHAHESGSWMMSNGPCGDFIDFTANDAPPSVTGSGQTLRYPIDIIGATGANTLVYRFFSYGGSANYFTGNVAWAFTTSGISNTSGTVRFSNVNMNSAPQLFNVPTITISGASNSAYNTTCTNTYAGTDQALYCTQASSTGQSNSGNFNVSLGSTQYGNTQFTLYPGAEVLDVLDYSASNCTATGKTAPCIDGTLTLEPNAGAWTVGHSVENSHHYASLVDVGREWVNVYNPMLQSGSAKSLMVTGTGPWGGQVGNWANNYALYKISNNTPASAYAYHGGTLPTPGGIAFQGSPENYLLGSQYAPEARGNQYGYGMYIGCPLSGCTDTGFKYNLFYLKGNGSDASLNYIPSTRAMQLNAGSLDLYYTPLLSPTIQSRANGQSATLIFNSIDSGSASHQWTLSAPTTGGGYTLTLPQATGTLALNNVFGAAGSSHSSGLVPDPGSTTDSSKFLRDDATWVNPLNNTGVTAGTYTLATITVGTDGRVTSASNGSASGTFPLVRNSNMTTGLTAATASNFCTYTPSVDGIYRITNNIWITSTTATGGTIASWLTMDGTASALSVNANATNRNQNSQTGYQKAGDAINIGTTYGATGGTATYNFTCTIEQLQ